MGAHGPFALLRVSFRKGFDNGGVRGNKVFNIPGYGKGLVPEVCAPGGIVIGCPSSSQPGASFPPRPVDFSEPIQYNKREKKHRGAIFAPRCAYFRVLFCFVFSNFFGESGVPLFLHPVGKGDQLFAEQIRDGHQA